jgi:hypothetical protein
MTGEGERIERVSTDRRRWTEEWSGPDHERSDREAFPRGRPNSRGRTDGRKEGSERRTRNGTRRPNDQALINKQVASVPTSTSHAIRPTIAWPGGRSVGTSSRAVRCDARGGASGQRRGASTEWPSDRPTERDSRLLHRSFLHRPRRVEPSLSENARIREVRHLPAPVPSGSVAGIWPGGRQI